MIHLATFVFVAVNLIVISVSQMLGVIGAPVFAMAPFPIIFQNAFPLGMLNQQTITVNGFREVRRRSAPTMIEETVVDDTGEDDEFILMVDISNVYFDAGTAPIEKDVSSEWEVEASGSADDSKFTEINYDTVSAASDVQISTINEMSSEGNVPVEEELANNIPIETIGLHTETEASELQASDLEASQFQASDLQASDHQASDLEANELQVSDLEASDLEASDLEASDLEASDLEASELQTSELQESQLQASQLQVSELQTSYLETSDLEATELEASDLERSQLQESQLQASQLQASDLEASELQTSELQESQLQASELQASELQAIELQAIDLQPSEFVLVPHNLKNGTTISDVKNRPDLSVPLRKKVPTSTKTKGPNSMREKGSALAKKKKPNSAKRRGPSKSRNTTNVILASHIDEAVTERNEPVSVVKDETVEWNMQSTDIDAAVEMKELVTERNGLNSEKNGPTLETAQIATEANKADKEEIGTETSEEHENDRISETNRYFVEMNDLVTSILEPILKRNELISADGLYELEDILTVDSNNQVKSHFDYIERDENVTTVLAKDELLMSETNGMVVTVIDHHQSNNLSKAIGSPKSDRPATGDDGLKRKHPIQYILGGKFVRKMQENIWVIVSVMLGFPIVAIASYFVHIHIRRRYTGSLDVSITGFNLQNKLLYSQPLSPMTRCSEENELLVCSSSTIALPSIPVAYNV